eukprot:CAMPEP_0117551328 /NCGR_PEP_ID=MMETSP0784-20121206/49137_1 /TAXON_ID=39447 /ORGANISM="" /LENGTH=275 /DNA_ID=CAMNT_0005348369 /DNA_START=25 /DNA_END=848 /DNA_ORIENTATION=-
MGIPMEFQIGSTCGIPIYIHVFLVAYFVYDLANKEAALKPAEGQLPDYGKAAIVALACAAGFLILFGTVLVHELGHCAGAKAVGGSVQKILLWPLGGLAFCGSGGGPAGDLVVALAGPLTHGPMYLAWYGLHTLAAESTDTFGDYNSTVREVSANAMSLQVVLVVFNLLVPVYPLDCSRIIEALCRLCGLSTRAAAIVICSLSSMCIVVLLCLMFKLFAVPYVSFGYHPMNLLIICWLAFQTYKLWDNVSRRDGGTHPLFAHRNRDDSANAGERA